jgi:hypothetical protein
MKKTLLFTLMAILIITAYSCKKDKTDTITPATSFYVNMDGIVWTTSAITAIRNPGFATTITATKSGSLVKFIVSFAGTSTGTYQLNLPNNVVDYRYGDNSINSMSLDPPIGQIIVTKYDASSKQISGTFTFAGQDSDGVVHHFNEGKFENVPYTE